MLVRIRSRVKKFFAAFALLSVELIIVWVLFLLALILFIVVADAIFLRKKDRFDVDMFQLLSHHVSTGVTGFMQVITFLGTHTFLIPANVVLILYFLVFRKHRWYSIKIPVVALGGVSLMFLLKFFFNRPRPLLPLLEPAKGLSFPSGHALMSVSFYGLLIFIIHHYISNKPLKWSLTIFFLVLILAIGLSRIYLRLHYASDVLAGYCVGIMWLVISLWTTSRIENYSRKEVDSTLGKKLTTA